MQEKFKYISDCEKRYKISNYGCVFFKKNNTWNLKKTSTTPDGYLKMVIRSNGIDKTYVLSRLVAIYFIENKNNHPQINHKNGDKLDNRACNLEWVNSRENRTHKVISTHKANGVNRLIGAKFCNFIKRWTSRISVNGHQRYLGSFLFEEEAHMMYLMALHYWGIENRYVS